MSGPRLLERRADRATLFHEPDADGVSVIETRYDVAPTLEASRREREAGAHGRDLRKVANIPSDVLARAFKQGWFHDPAAWRKWASDPANAKFRVWEGRY